MDAVARGIDVSYAQGIIDWKKVKSSGVVDFAIIRSSASYPHSGRSGVDTMWEHNIEGAKTAGLPVGAYHYCYAMTIEEAKQEAKHFVDTIRPYTFEYPVALDFEDECQKDLSTRQMADICTAFLEIVQSAGYYACLYSMASWLKGKLTDARLKKYDVWVAHVDVTSPMLAGGMWQYSWKGRVPGISGDVDFDFAYKDYPSIMRTT